MSRMMLFCVVISVFFIGCDKSGSDVDGQASTEPLENKIIGTWKVNVERSIEKVKTSPKVKPEDFDKLPSMVERMAEKLQMEITESELKMVMGTREQALGYAVTTKDMDAKSVTVSINEAEGVTVVFTIIDDDYLNSVSSGTDDMNYYIWEQVE